MVPTRSDQSAIWRIDSTGNHATRELVLAYREWSYQETEDCGYVKVGVETLASSGLENRHTGHWNCWQTWHTPKILGSAEKRYTNHQPNREFSTLKGSKFDFLVCRCNETYAYIHHIGIGKSCLHQPIRLGKEIVGVMVI